MLSCMRSTDQHEVAVRLAATQTKQGVKLWCSELYVDGRIDHASDWTEHVVDAITDGRDLLAAANSDWAYREARYEAAELFARAC